MEWGRGMGFYAIMGFNQRLKLAFKAGIFDEVQSGSPSASNTQVFPFKAIGNALGIEIRGCAFAPEERIPLNK